MQEVKCFLYDAFSAQAFGGNVAGVVVLDAPLASEVMQALAAELNAPTTAFVEITAPDRYHVRFFSSSSEMDMCGHVTIGAACALVDRGQLQGDCAIQDTRAGLVRIAIDRSGPTPWIEMQQRCPVFAEAQHGAGELAAMLGLPASALHPGIAPGYAGTGLKHLFVALQSEASLAKMRRDDAALSRFCRSHRIDTIGVFAITGHRSAGHCCAQLRDLCHGVGNPEESASGTTNGALASFLFHRGVIAPLDDTIVLTVTQGRDMGREARIGTTLRVRNGEVLEVRVGGTAVRTLSGVLQFE